MTPSFIHGKAFQAMTLAVLAVALFANTLGNPLVWDDEQLIRDNVWIRSLSNVPGFFLPEYWNEHHPVQDQVQYRPVRITTFALDYALWGSNPLGCHLTNLLLHGANVLLFHLLLAGWLRRRETVFPRGLPFLAALLFLVHPIHSEVINMVKNRSELLAFFFSLSALTLFIRSMEAKGKRSAIYLAGTLISFFLALGSKETAVALPFIAVVYGLVFLPRNKWRGWTFHTLPLFVLLGGFFLFRALAFTGHETPPMTDLTPWVHVSVVIKTITYYLWMITFPFNLVVERLLPASLLSVQVLGGGVLWAGALALGWKSRKSAPALTFAILFFLLALAPAANVHYLESRPIAEQRLYLPSAGFCLVLAYGLLRLTGSQASGKGWLIKAGAGTAAGAIFLLYASGTLAQNRLWGNPIQLWTRATQSAPERCRAFFNLGNAFMEAKEYDPAIQSFEKAIELNAEYSDAHNNLSNVLATKGDYMGAIQHLSAAIEINPHVATYYYNLGNVLLESGQGDRAILYYEMALNLNPGLGMANNNLGNILAGRGKIEEAIALLQNAIATNPGHTNARHNLANLLAKTGDWQQARSHFEKALELEPENSQLLFDYANLLSQMGLTAQSADFNLKALILDPDNPEIHVNLGNALARQSRYTEALLHYHKALELAPDNPQTHTNLGIALADLGRVDEALSQFKTALEKKPDFAPAWYNMGYVLAKQGRHTEAIPDFRKALELNGDYGQALYEMGNSLAHLGRLDEAEKYLQKAVEVFPEDARTWHNLGVVLARQGRLESAVEAFEKALSLNADYPEARKNLEAAKRLIQEKGS